MVQSQFLLSWDSHKSSFCSGFSALQQNGEFVDMTLAADGHFVKVHQVLMALASPYLKELITSAPCQHPVIFLNNVSHKSLSSLLEYIYTGEVLISPENLNSFIETARSLHIKGLETMSSSDSFPTRMSMNIPQREESDKCHISGFRNIDVLSRDSSEQISVPTSARKIVIKTENTDMSVPASSKLKTLPVLPISNEMVDFPIIDEPSHDSDDDQFGRPEIVSQGPKLINQLLNPNTMKEKLSSNLQFTVSIRGSLQVILNRYIYNLHSVTRRTGVRRWRCVDYRNHKCMAFVVTKKNVVLSRGNLHNHPFHDKKILSKIEKNTIYSALDDVEGYQDKEPIDDSSKNESAMEPEELLSLDYSSNEDTLMKNA